MARFLFLVAAFVAAAAGVAEASVIAPAGAPALLPAPDTIEGKFSIKLILHNVAHRPVTFKIVSPVVSKPVVCLKNKWNAITPTLISSKQRTLQVSVEVDDNKHVAVQKTLTIFLLKHFDASELKGQKFLVLTAVESWSWKAKYLLITMGEVVVLSIKL